MTSRLIIGCGYLGRRIAAHWYESSREVFALTRSTETATQFSKHGWNPIIGDITKPESVAPLPEVDTVLLSVGFDRHAGYDIHTAFVDGIQNTIAKLPSNISRLIYISSTGVYSQSNGEWVDEESTCEPQRPGGVACLEAERFLQQSRFSDRLVILRLAGIYGPERIPRMASIQKGEPISSPRHGYINLIHVDDAVQAVAAAGQYKKTPATFVIGDDEPVIRSDYFGFVAKKLNAPSVSFSEPEADSHVVSRAMADKRIRNSRMRMELGIDLKYPTYREGITAILESH
ncbi:MAG TPA: NAD(P)-dependent oxidoreductase [Planctomycetaceae bacterium]|jgi:nucleoside-diphosphate-sugar epimerase|nr:NAD(P)-dependent oxidoreductase [Rhodopirellula sp.]HCK72252.1 NAD(P)-dependent oxidoreductase [Planctomycetaceae bacterium]|tara:strand:+ start:2469 stop:3332 length:864 start_codon:yes stop_codon:yes gene_type:complete